MPFTGQSVRVLREALRLAPQQFASLVGVSPSTISRWELAGKDMLRPEPLQLQLLTVIEQELGKRPTAERRDAFVDEIGRALLIGGGLLALYRLLDAAFGVKETAAKPLDRDSGEKRRRPRSPR
jgi:transcriptional regulator with XRE-family HTH domain